MLDSIKLNLKKIRSQWMKKWKIVEDFTDRHFVPLIGEYPVPYLVALLAVASAIVLTDRFSFFWNSPEVLFMATVVFSAWYGGLGPGFLAIVLTVMAYDYFYLPPLGQVNFLPNDLSPLIAYILLAVLIDSLVASQRRAEDIIRNQALHDYLTGLPNRRLFEDRFATGLSRAVRNDEQLGLIIVDMDNFKHINDSLGHKAGDSLIRIISERLQSVLRAEDTLARWGGDEFVIMLPEVNKVTDVVAVVEKITSIVSEPYSINNVSILVTCSFGVAVFPEHGLDPQELFRNADAALYEAKHEGRNRYKIYVSN